MQLFIFFCLPNYFDSDECCFPTFNDFSKLTDVLGYLEINYKLGKIRVLILQTEQLLVFAKEHITKSCPKKPEWVDCQPVSSLSLTSWNASKCQKSMLVRKSWVPLVSVWPSSRNEGVFFLKKVRVRGPPAQISHDEWNTHTFCVLCKKKNLW